MCDTDVWSIRGDKNTVFHCGKRRIIRKGPEKKGKSCQAVPPQKKWGEMVELCEKCRCGQDRADSGKIVQLGLLTCFIAGTRVWAWLCRALVSLDGGDQKVGRGLA